MRNRMAKPGAAIAALALWAVSACTAVPAPAPEAAGAPKGYVVAEIDVTNPEPYKDYLAAVTPMVAEFGGRYIVRAGKAEAQEGDAPAGRMVVLEFPSFEAAKTFMNSPEYGAIVHLRTDNAVSRIMILEGTAP